MCGSPTQETPVKTEKKWWTGRGNPPRPRFWSGGGLEFKGPFAGVEKKKKTRSFWGRDEEGPDWSLGQGGAAGTKFPPVKGGGQKRGCGFFSASPFV